MRVNNRVVREWQNEIGTVDEAADHIRVALSCSYSKAEKLAGGRYFHGLTHFEQQALSKLIKKDALFNPPGKAETRAS